MIWKVILLSLLIIILIVPVLFVISITTMIIGTLFVNIAEMTLKLANKIVEMFTR